MPQRLLEQLAGAPCCATSDSDKNTIFSSPRVTVIAVVKMYLSRWSHSTEVPTHGHTIATECTELWRGCEGVRQSWLAELGWPAVGVWRCRRPGVGRRGAAGADKWNRRMEGSFVVADLLVGQPRDTKISGVVSDLVDGKGSSRLVVPFSYLLEPLPFLDRSAPRL
uniref:Uncharacterized protein n=1 Tax=Oryza glumipatula TaxID=40148 RepID=A0A0E0B6P9_9ORYZ